MKTDIEKENLSGSNRDGANANFPVRVLTAKSVIGDKVLNNQDKEIGEIKDIMLDIRRGLIEYVVVETNSFLGLGGKLFAIPFNELHIKPSRHAFTLTKGDDFLKKAPGFDKDHWPETNSHHYADVQGYWGDFMGASVGNTF